MSLIAPHEGRLRTARRRPPDVDVSLRDLDGVAELSLLHRPTTLMLTITNRSPATIFADERVEPSLVPIGDGLLLARKR